MAEFDENTFEDVETEETISEEQKVETTTETVETETEETEETETTEQVETEEVKAYRADQSKKDKRISTLEKDKSASDKTVNELMDRLSKLEKPEEKNTLVKPVRPAKPAGYNRLDSNTDEESVSGKYAEALEQYHFDMEDYREAVDTKRQEKDQVEEDRVLRVKQSTDYANQQIAAYMELGLSKPEAVECFEWYWTNEESKAPEVLVSNWKSATKGKPRPPSKGKPKIPLPLGISGGETNKKTVTDDDAFHDNTFEKPEERTI